MKIKTAIFILSILSVSQSAFAVTPADKFLRGLEGLVSSPLEYFNQYRISAEKRSIVPSLAVGVLGGTLMTVKRLLNGVYDVVSFPVNLPKNYRLLLNDDTETAWQNYKSLQNKNTNK